MMDKKKYPPPPLTPEERERIRKEEMEAPPPTPDPKYQMSLREKERGNQLFAQNDHKRAILAWLQALSILFGVPEPMKKSGVFKHYKLTLHLNLAAGYLKYKGKEDRAFEHLDIVLEAQPDNVKAIYRKGMVYLAQRDLDHAREWLQKGRGPEFEAGLKQIAELDKKADERAKNTFAGMFDRIESAGGLYADAKPAPPPPKEEDEDEKEEDRFMHRNDEEGERRGMRKIDVKKMREQQAATLAAKAAGVPPPTFEDDKELLEKERMQYAGMFDRHAGELYPDAKPAPPAKIPGDDEDESSTDEDEKFRRMARGHAGSEEEEKGRPPMQHIDVKKLREQQAAASVPHPSFDDDHEMMEQQRRQFAGMFDRHAGELYPDAKPAPPSKIPGDDDEDGDDESSGSDDGFPKRPGKR